MFAQERYDKITEILKNEGSVKVSQLADVFNVSIETIRRDLLFLETKGVLKRVHGGAIADDKRQHFNTLSERLNENKAQKRSLSQAAAEFISENDTIAIDSGSTAVEFAAVLKGKFYNLTIVTHSIDVFNLMRETENNIILLGGQYCRNEAAFYGAMALDALKRLHVNKSFIFPSAVSIEHGVEDYVLEIVPIQQGYMKISDKNFVLADSSKFESRAFIKLCDTDDSCVFVTDDKLGDDIYNLYIQNSINIFRSEK